MKKVKTNFLKLKLTPVYQISATKKFGPDEFPAGPGETIATIGGTGTSSY